MKQAIAFLLMSLLLGCQTHTTSPHLSETEVMALATARAEKENYKLEDFTPRKPKFDPLQENREWHVLFEGKRPYPGNHFMIFIDDKTSETRLSRGR
jgi:hypothetical protein